MLARSRIGTTVDTSRLSRAVSRPGIDPRTWCAYAVVTAVHVDDGHGVFADVTVMPLGQQATARVALPYAGSGFGAHLPLQVDDEVLVQAPNGDPNNGYVVTERLWSPSDLPPPEVSQSPADVLLVVKPGASCRVVVSGGGDVVVEARDAGKVRLGGPDATVPVALATDLSSKMRSILDSSEFVAAVAAYVAAPVPATYKAAVDALFAAVTFGAGRVVAE